MSHSRPFTLANLNTYTYKSLNSGTLTFTYNQTNEKLAKETTYDHPLQALTINSLNHPTQSFVYYQAWPCLLFTLPIVATITPLSPLFHPLTPLASLPPLLTHVIHPLTAQKSGLTGQIMDEWGTGTASQVENVLFSISDFGRFCTEPRLLPGDHTFAASLTHF